MAKFSDAAADIFYLSGLTDSDTNVNLIIYITDDNSTFFGHYERGILSDTEYEECCYVYSRCDAGYLIVQDNDIEITGVYNYYNPITGG